MRIVAIDPGVTTGWVVAEYEEGVPYVEQFGQETFENPIEAARTMVRDVLPQADVVVAEQFDLRPHNKFVADLSPVEVNSILKYHLLGSDTELVWVTPAEHKSLVTNEVLKRLGWYVMPKQVGQKDANDVRDAFRLLTHYLVEKQKDKEFTLVGWPR